MVHFLIIASLCFLPNIVSAKLIGYLPSDYGLHFGPMASLHAAKSLTFYTKKDLDKLCAPP